MAERTLPVQVVEPSILSATHDVLALNAFMSKPVCPCADVPRSIFWITEAADWVLPSV